MTYNKPKAIVLNRAIDAIESGQGKPGSAAQDNSLPTPNTAATSAAYEADE